jgi:opacity protein-like surface antigen
MKHFLRGAAIAAALSVTAFSAAQAQTAQRVYDNGTVWSVSFVETKPGMFDDYLAYLNTSWKQSQEAGKKLGDVVSYKVLTLVDPRDGEADIVLIVEYKNMGVMDRSLDELDKQTSAVFGSPVKANQAAVSRESLRTLRGNVLARELKFK